MKMLGFELQAVSYLHRHLKDSLSALNQLNRISFLQRAPILLSRKAKPGRSKARSVDQTGAHCDLRSLGAPDQLQRIPVMITGYAGEVLTEILGLSEKIDAANKAPIPLELHLSNDQSVSQTFEVSTRIFGYFAGNGRSFVLSRCTLNAAAVLGPAPAASSSSIRGSLSFSFN